MSLARASLLLSLPFLFLACAGPEGSDSADPAYMEDVGDYLDADVKRDRPPTSNRCTYTRCIPGYICCDLPGCDLCIPQEQECSRRACSGA
jgi:hypothetical protein